MKFKNSFCFYAAALWIIVSISYAQFLALVNPSAQLMYTLNGSNQVVTVAFAGADPRVFVITNPPRFAVFASTFGNTFQVTSLQN